MTDAYPDLGKAALWYASNGWPVFPLVRLRKTPLTPHGFKDASTSTDQVIDWWSVDPQANIGVVTGPLDTGGCGLDVWDADTPEAVELLKAQVSHPKAPRMVALSRTPRGVHLWVPADGSPRKIGVIPGLDYLGVGGYAVAPPSKAPAGGWLWRQPPWRD